VIFLLKYHQKRPSDGAQKKEKNREKTYLKKEKKKKRGRKRKAPRVSSNKGEVNILRGENYFHFKIHFLM
jgi:hypothetical protein